MTTANPYYPGYENEYRFKPWHDLKDYNSSLRTASCQNRPRNNGALYGGSGPATRPASSRGYSASPGLNKPCNVGQLALFNNCSTGLQRWPYSHRHPPANIYSDGTLRSHGHPSAKVQGYDVLQSHCRLPKTTLTSYGLDYPSSSTHSCQQNNIPNRWAPNTPSGHGLLSPGPTCTTAGRSSPLALHERMRLERTLKETEQAELDLAVTLSLLEEAKRREQLWKEEEAAHIMLNEKGRRNSFHRGHWLSDASIARVYSELAAGNIGNIVEKPQPFPDEILLMDPAVAFWHIQQDLESAELAATGSNLQEKQLVLCPINDSANGGCADGGGHWTLLVAWRSGKEANCNDNDGGLSFKNFKYYDSMFTGNPRTRSRVNAQKLARVLSGDATYVLRENTCAQQENNYDCGVYVIAFSEIIATVFMRAKKESRSIENQDGTPVWTDSIQRVSSRSVTSIRRYYLNAFEEADNQVKEADSQSNTNHESQR